MTSNSASLYRRWRPKSFGDLVGQDAVVRTLRAALTSGRLAHAYLFSGPRGSGKTSAAKILARCVDCVLGPTPDPDNSCENCLAIIAGTALDVLEIDAASNRGINEIRELREAVKYAPAQMRMKVYILDEAHAITPDGANAFLKTLEEPPAHVLFILATTAPERLPPTILSRCQRYAFRRIPVATMIDRMRAIADKEAIAIDDAALAAIAYRADGGLRDALTMLEQVAAFAGGTPVDAAAIDAAFGATGRRYARDLVRATLRGDAAASLRIIDEACDAGAEMQELLRGAIAEQRNLLVARLSPELLSRDLAAEDASAVREAAAGISEDRLIAGLRLFSEALGGVRFSPNPRLDVETAVMRLLVDGAGTASVTAPLPASTSQTPSQTDAPPATGELQPEPNLQRVRSLWQSIRTRVEGERKPLRAPLSRATVDSVTSGTIVLGLTEPAQAEILREHRGIVERAASELLGVPVHVQVRVDRSARESQSRGAHRASASGEPPQNASEDDLLDYASKTIASRVR
ncbi:MAG: DNA polymerase III subunit gamma/tau [Candidatus Eremiobacteraeota bacterium]|nr:DNA polymerase III subunit gamma/tau [Candidatus Eremiobacteraeota bacterium]MBV9647943.1 DNA polymerase III subunit gamma/tau [Candidatus Eremiobacteraeota bacterium]